MNLNNLLLETSGPVATVTVNRPDKLNALNRATIEELQRVFVELDTDSEVRAIVLTGAGEKAFVAGADIAEIREQTPAQARRLSEHGQRLMQTIELLETPVVAAINGYALGGGLELALACHLRLAASTARLGLPEISLGLMPGFGGTQRLARLVGTGRALEMTLTGAPIKADRAEQLGLVNRIHEPSDLQQQARMLAEALAAAAPEAVRGILQAIQVGADGSMQAGLALETARFAVCCATEDMREGTAAFLEKRKPTFTGT